MSKKSHVIWLACDISEVESEVIVNAANAKGWMGGVIGRWIKCKGVAESLHFTTKGNLEQIAKKEAKKTKAKKGNVFVTSSSGLSCTWVFHAVTVARPGFFSDSKTIEQCLQNLSILLKKHQIKSIALPSLGTGTGRVDYQEVARLYKKYLTEWNEVTIYIVDPSGNLKKHF